MDRKIFILLLGFFLINLVYADVGICIDKDAPLAPTNLEVLGDINGIFLSWNEAMDEPDCSGIKYYEIYKNEELMVSTSLLNYSDDNLSYDVYIYSINAIDLAENKGLAVNGTIILTSPDNPPVTTGGSGGGGGTPKSTLNLGINKILQKGISYKFTINSEEHTLKIDEVGTDYVWVIISSEPQRIKLKLGGGSQKIDLDGDGILDMELELISLNSNGKVEIDYQPIKKDEEGKLIEENTLLEGFSEIPEDQNQSQSQESTFSRITGAVTGALGTTGTTVVIVFLVGILGSSIAVRGIRKRKAKAKKAQGEEATKAIEEVTKETKDAV